MITPVPDTGAEVEWERIPTPALNWDTFADLPGAATDNFEMLCRSLIRRHYSRFGDFRALANQPGVEFHLRLHSACELGEAGRWYGWQCKWYGLQSGRAIGKTRRRKVEDAITKTEAVLPDVTDWVLWTRYPLTKGDQEWYYGLRTRMQLHLWNGAEVEEHLGGPAEILRGTYFGELVLRPEMLGKLHAAAVAPIKRRWRPEVHQVIDAERALGRALGALGAWPELISLVERLDAGAQALDAGIPDLPPSLEAEAEAMVRKACALRDSLVQIKEALGHGDYDVLRQELAGRVRPEKKWDSLLREFRAGRHPVSLQATNLVADMHGWYEAMASLDLALSQRMVAVIADAGCGKTQLAAQLTAATDERPAGILMHGRDLHAGNNLDDLAGRLVINGVRVESFEALVAAVDAAGQRAGRRLPIVLDGLNEAEDPRDWKIPLASSQVILDQYPYTLVVCTLRSAFVDEALPDELDQLEIPGFEQGTSEAVRRYFRYYKIDAGDALLPLRLLGHPLTLSMFCEVTNPTRERTVGVEAMPSSLTALFDRYLEQVAERVAQLAPRSWKYYESDLRTALDRIGFALWEANDRSIDIEQLRNILGDDGRSWDTSIVRALEHDGVLIRIPSDRSSAGGVAVVYDALAGHLVADSLLGAFAGQEFEPWLKRAETASALSGDINERHPLSNDILRALVGLMPRRMHRRQLWPLLDEPLKTEALHEAAWLEASYLDSETVTKIAALAAKTPTRRYDLFDRLWSTRAARSHPLDAEFLDSVLRTMSVPDRDLRWTEWIRRRTEEVLKDLKRIEERWRTGQPGDNLRARWVMWTLTSTARLLRDHATRALYRFGCIAPNALFDLTVDSLAVNDPYVPERMLAACYGVAMTLWADPRGEKVRSALPDLANALLDQMFVPGAPHPTRHVLMRDSALGVIALARRISPACISEDRLGYVVPPFKHLPSAFRDPGAIDEADVADAKEAIHMDFGNYTIGRLIRDRGNYDYDNPTYQEVRRQIEARIVDLGYSSARFRTIDKAIAEDAWRANRHGAAKTDRYGKKYSWIAFFEMYGLCLDQGTLPEWRAGERTSDVDIDPSFPKCPRTWVPSLPDLFTNSPVEPQAWIANGPTPEYGHLLNLDEVDGQPGPWALLEGFVEQSAASDNRRVFTFLRGVFVRVDEVSELLAAFGSRDYPGNSAIPEPQDDHYTYAGEIPWSLRFGTALRDAKGEARPDQRDAFHYHDGTRWRSGILVEVPVCRFSWEEYHSKLNQVSGIMLPAPALCERFGLTNRQGEWDLYDASGDLATIYRQFQSEHDQFSSYLTYIRCDLLADYLKRSGQELVWMLWGEREFHHRTGLGMMDELQDLLAEYRHIHRRAVIFTH